MFDPMGFSQLFTGNAAHYTCHSLWQIAAPTKIVGSNFSLPIPLAEAHFLPAALALRHLFRIMLYGMHVLCSFTA
jgi:hypothetical protein